MRIFKHDSKSFHLKVFLIEILIKLLKYEPILLEKIRAALEEEEDQKILIQALHNLCQLKINLNEYINSILFRIENTEENMKNFKQKYVKNILKAKIKDHQNMILLKMKEVFLINYREWKNKKKSLKILSYLLSVTNPSFKLKPDKVHEIITFFINSKENANGKILLEIYKMMQENIIEEKEMESVK